MAETNENLGAFIKERREARGLTQQQLGDMAKTSQQNIDRIEKGFVKKSQFIDPILAALGSDMGRALEQSVTVEDVVPRETLVASRDLPIYASAEGGEGAILINRDPIEFVTRPAVLLHVKESFGVLVVEESMKPVYKPGSILLVNPRMQPRREQNAVFVGPESNHTVRALVKQYDGQTQGIWRVTQHNPHQSFELSKADWPKCYAVVGSYDPR